MSYENASSITLPDIFIRPTETRGGDVCPSCVQRSNSLPATITSSSSLHMNNVQELLPNKYLEAGTRSRKNLKQQKITNEFFV